MNKNCFDGSMVVT